MKPGDLLCSKTVVAVAWQKIDGLWKAFSIPHLAAFILLEGEHRKYETHLLVLVNGRMGYIHHTCLEKHA